MTMFVVIWIGRDGKAEFHGVWSSRELAEQKALSITGEYWIMRRVYVIEAVVDVSPAEPEL